MHFLFATLHEKRSNELSIVHSIEFHTLQVTVDNLIIKIIVHGRLEIFFVSDKK